MAQAAGYSNSRTWVNPSRQQDLTRRAFNEARNRICRYSPFLTPDFDLLTHKAEWMLLKERAKGRPRSVSSEWCIHIGEQRWGIQHLPTLPSPREAFGGKTIGGPGFIEDYSMVICEKTVFTPQFADAMEYAEPWPIEDDWPVLFRPKIPKAIAPWPRRDEMKYEGDDRIATERIHARCLGLPRVSGNETVNWQHRAAIVPSNLDDHTYHPCQAEVLERGVSIAEIEDFSGMNMDTPAKILGEDLFKLLDPVGKL